MNIRIINVTRFLKFMQINYINYIYETETLVTRLRPGYKSFSF